jgi:hypothetical protein
LLIASLTDSSVTFSWLTDSATTGYVLYGETADLAQVAVDVRAESVEAEANDTLSSKAHLVTLTNLKPETTYYFKVVSGAEDEGTPQSFTTLPSLESIPESDTVYGRLFSADGSTPATDSLIYLTLQDADGDGSQKQAALLSALVDQEGYWQANLANARLDDGSAYFAYSASGDALLIEAQNVTGSLHESIDTADDAQAPDMRLTTEPTSITVGRFRISSSPFSLLGMALLALAFTMLAGVLIARRQRSS